MRCYYSTTHFRFQLFIPIVAVVELFYPAAGIDKLLFAGEERMALGADIDGNNVGLLGSARFKSIAACTDDSCFSVLGMNGIFHAKHLV